MTSPVGWSTRAEKQLAKLDRQIAKTPVCFMSERVNPPSIGKQLKDPELWRHRVGEYGILCRTEDQRFTVLVVELGHRREVYRR